MSSPSRAGTDIALRDLRLFAEEITTYARVLYTDSKSTASLLAHLENMAIWVPQHVPGGRFMVIRSDFGSELVRQGHGNDMVVAALTQYCAANPGFRVWPVAPHNQAANKVENSWGHIQGGTFMNGLRSRVGHKGWSLMQTGAQFQHNHTNAPRGCIEAMRTQTRSFALTGELN